MKIKTGVDIVYLPRFKKVIKNGGESFLKRIFLEEEITGETVHLAGIFAAKEAVIKALSLKTGSWHNIIVTNNPDGSPEAKILNSQFSILNSSLSISHDGDYVIAQFVALIK